MTKHFTIEEHEKRMREVLRLPLIKSGGEMPAVLQRLLNRAKPKVKPKPFEGELK